MKKIISIIGARPQFIKHAPMELQLSKNFHSITIHTGQHFDKNMSQIFFDELNIPKPNYIIELDAPKNHGEQTAKMMIDIENILLKEKPDFVLVYGDTNSTLAGALVASKLQIKIIHIEAGLRSFNKKMPEEINRVVTDHLSDLLFYPTKEAIANLTKEGINKNVYLTGDVMCDILKLVEPRLKQYENSPYYFVTLHRPYNTDDENRLLLILENLNVLDKKIIFSIHPRTSNKLKNAGVDITQFTNIKFIEPLGYVDCLSYQMYSDCIITDSGGIQKESYILKKKCITIRKETEWKETLKEGWNTLVFEDLASINNLIATIPGTHLSDLYGNGTAAEEIVNILYKI